MRSAGLILLAALMAFVPAVQAQGCFCDSAAASGISTPDSSCCCGDTAACSCAACPDHAPADDGGRRSMSGCACTQTQPQSTADSKDEIVLAEALAPHGVPAAIAAPAHAPVALATEGGFRPPSNRPLLV
ncbi:MAG: hypothetical protein ACYTGN_05025 [Planctomycetota bacterium]|jgi:hypothetical protein